MPASGRRNLECWELSCAVHLHAPVTTMAGCVCDDSGNGRKLRFPMKDVCCPWFGEPVVALRYKMTINMHREMKGGEMGEMKGRGDEGTAYECVGVIVLMVCPNNPHLR